MRLPVTRGVYYYRATLCTIDPLLAKYPYVMSANRHTDVFAWLMCTRSTGYTHSDLRMIKFTTASRVVIKAYRITVMMDGETADVLLLVGRRGDLRKYLYGTSTRYHSGTPGLTKSLIASLASRRASPLVSLPRASPAISTSGLRSSRKTVVISRHT